MNNILLRINGTEDSRQTNFSAQPFPANASNDKNTNTLHVFQQICPYISAVALSKSREKMSSGTRRRKIKKETGFRVVAMDIHLNWEAVGKQDLFNTY